MAFKPQWILIKSTTSAGDWTIYDSARLETGQSNRSNNVLYPNKDDKESDNSDAVTYLDNGFRIDGNTQSSTGETYIYVAIAKDVVAGNSPPTGIVSDAKDADNTITLTDVKGTWAAGMRATGDKELTQYGPSADEINFTGNIPDGTSIINWNEAIWEVDTDVNFGSAMQDTKAITNEFDEQTLEPSDYANINLAADTTYYARLKYSASNPVLTSNDSAVVTFKTAPITRDLTPTVTMYDAANDVAITDAEIIERYGVDPTGNLEFLNIYELTEQPDYCVLGYTKVGDKYQPICDYSAELQSLRETLVARIEQLEADHNSAMNNMNNNGGSNSGY